MERIDRERWNKLSDQTKAIMRVMLRFTNAGKVSLNDLRMVVDMRSFDSRSIIMTWQELESRQYGHIDKEDPANPVFVMNVAAFQTLAQTHRLTDQAPVL